MPNKSSKRKQEADPAKVLVAVYLDRDVHEWLQAFGDDYSGEINRILRAEMERVR